MESSATGSGDSSLLPLFLKGVATLLFPLLCLLGRLRYGRCRKQCLVAWAAFGEGKGPVSSGATLAGACLLCAKAYYNVKRFYFRLKVIEHVQADA